MRVLHVMSERGAHGGGEIFALDVVSAFKKRDVEQFVICRPYEGFLRPLRDNGISFETFDFNKWNKWFQKRLVGRKILRRIKSYAPDVVHCWMPTAADWTPAGIGVPVLGWFGAYLDIKHYKNCDYHIGCAPDLADWIRKKSGHPDRVFMVNTFVSLKEDKPLSRKKFGIPDEKPVILMLARMSPVKGVDILLRAAVEMDVFLLLAGDGHMLGHYRDLAQELGIESRVRFIGWRDDRSALLDIADVLAVPSRYEPFGTVMAEAWYKGVPVVASRADGPRQYIEHGMNGMLSDIEDIEGLAKNLRAVIENDSLRKKIITGGTRTVSQFSEEVVVSNLLRTYEEIIRRGVIRNQ